MGQLYRRGRIFWVKYYVNGRPIRESTGFEKEKAAERFLKVREGREGRPATGVPILPRADRVRYDEAAADLRGHYAATGAKGLRESETRFKHHQPRAGGARTPAAARLREPQAPAPACDPEAQDGR